MDRERVVWTGAAGGVELESLSRRRGRGSGRHGPESSLTWWTGQSGIADLMDKGDRVAWTDWQGAG